MPRYLVTTHIDGEKTSEEFIELTDDQVDKLLSLQVDVGRIEEPWVPKPGQLFLANRGLGHWWGPYLRLTDDWGMNAAALAGARHGSKGPGVVFNMTENEWEFRPPTTDELAHLIHES